MASAASVQHLFLQRCMQDGVMTRDDAVKLYSAVCEAVGVRREERPFSAFVTAVNRQLKPLGFELARGATEDSGEEWLGFVNRAEDAASKLTAFKPAELELFNKIMEHLVMGGEGVGEKSELVRLASGLERKMAYKEAEDFLKMLLRDRWLHEVTSTVYGPGPRFILELRPFLKDLFGDECVSDCHLCKEPVIRGQRCCHANCDTSLHLYCIGKLTRTSPRCPKCHGDWPTHLA